MTRETAKGRMAKPTAGAILALLLLSVHDGAAQEVVGIDAGAIAARVGGKWGFDVDGRVGYRTGLPRALIVHSVIVQLEAIGGYERLLAPGADGGLGRLGGGARVGGLLGWLEPFAFGHVSAADSSGDWGSLWDVGVALDWRIRAYSVGVHYTHDWLFVASTRPQFEEVGIHAEGRGFWLF